MSSGTWTRCSQRALLQVPGLGTAWLAVRSGSPQVLALGSFRSTRWRIVRSSKPLPRRNLRAGGRTRSLSRLRKRSLLATREPARQSCVCSRWRRGGRFGSGGRQSFLAFGLAARTPGFVRFAPARGEAVKCKRGIGSQGSVRCPLARISLHAPCGAWGGRSSRPLARPSVDAKAPQARQAWRFASGCEATDAASRLRGDVSQPRTVQS